MAVAVSPTSLVKHFESLPDPRHTRNRRHLLVDVIAIAVCGVMAGCEGPTSLALWARSKREFLATFLELPAGLPSRDCLRRVLSLLKPEAFQQCFQEWVAACLTANDDADAKTGVQHIAIDGKTLRRSHDRGRALGPLHIVSAWASAQGLSLGQLATEEKSNEITAIPHLIEQIDVQGAVVTIDAMGCQTEIARQIVANGGDYVLAVKDNQPKLCEAIHAFFDEHVQDDLARVPHRHCETLDESHGRRDYRYYDLAKLPADWSLAAQWPGLKAIGKAVRITEHSDGRESFEIRYYIVSRYLSGQRFAAAVRGHWGIENSLHWVLDVVFNEDQSRARERRLADNLSWLRRFAVGLLKRHPGKESIKCKMKMAGWNNDFLTKVLAG
jgi:predicted transposase YbfD/YdcC